jgi:tRNA U55 pseudouridine synthase TruB
MTRLATLTALALSLAGVCFGAYSVAREATIFDRAPERSIEEYDRIASGGAELGLSAYSKKQILNSCYYGLGSRLALVRPAAEIRRFASQCFEKANAITATMPTNSFAWLVAAVAAEALDDHAGMNAALVHSQRTGPREQWITELRVRLAEDNYARLDDNTRKVNEMDLAVLADSYRGVRTIASRYVNDADFRERITTVVSALPADVQKRFLWSVKKAARESLQ